jgi:DNA-directed RNA polymerase subunit RPC12/RpoP
MKIMFEILQTVCRHNDAFEDINCNPICELRSPKLKNLGSRRYTGESVLCNKKNCPVVKADQVPESTKKEYLMQYECCNCKTRFTKSIPMGQLAEGRGGKCPYCGADDHLNYEIDWSHKVIGAYTPGKWSPMIF